MFKQTTESGLLIREGDELVTYVTYHEDLKDVVAMKYVVNETTGWYCSASRLKEYGTVIELYTTKFAKHRDLYLNDNIITAPVIREVSDYMFLEEVPKGMRYFSEALSKVEKADLTNEKVLQVAQNVLDAFYWTGTPLNNDILSTNKRVRMRAKDEVKKLRIFIHECKKCLA